MVLKESAYDWAKIPVDLPKQNLVLITAKTTLPTIHPEDPEYSVRIFESEELKEAARSLARRPVGLNHTDKVIENAFTVDSQWNESTQAVEALLYLPTEYINLIRKEKLEGREVKFSVEYNWREEERTKDGVIFKGLVFNRVDMLYGKTPGDRLTSAKLVESKLKRGLMEAVMVESYGWSIEDIKKRMDELEKEREEISKKLYPETKVPNEEQLRKRLSEIDAEMQGLKLRVGELILYPPVQEPKKEGGETNIKQDQIQQSIDNPSMSFFKTEEEASEFFRALGEPFAGYANFQDCVAKNQDKGNPKAYCATIMRKVEKPKKEEGTLVEDTYEPPEAGTLPEKGKEILSKSYASCRTNYPEYSKERCSKIAWGAVKNAGYTKEDDKWVKKEDVECPEVIDKAFIEALDKNIPPEQAITIQQEPPKQEPVVPISTTTGMVITKDEDKIKDATAVPVAGTPQPLIEPISNTTSAKQKVESTAEKKDDKKAVSSTTPTETPKQPEIPKEGQTTPVQGTSVGISTTQSVVDPKDVRIKELEEAVTKLQTNVTKADSEKAKAVKEAKKDMKKQLIEELEAILPNTNIIQNFNRGGQIIALEVKRKVHQLKESLKEE